MAKAIKWSSPSAASSGNAIAGTALNALANDARVIGSEIDNETGKHMYADFELLCDFASNPSAGGYVALYLIPSLDGTNYADGDASIVPAESLLVGAFPVQANTNDQRIHLRGVLLPPLKFKPLVVNKSGQAFTSDNDHALSYRTYNEEVQ